MLALWKGLAIQVFIEAKSSLLASFSINFVSGQLNGDTLVTKHETDDNICLNLSWSIRSMIPAFVSKIATDANQKAKKKGYDWKFLSLVHEVKNNSYYKIESIGKK